MLTRIRIQNNVFKNGLQFISLPNSRTESKSKMLATVWPLLMVTEAMIINIISYCWVRVRMSVNSAYITKTVSVITYERRSLSTSAVRAFCGLVPALVWNGGVSLLCSSECNSLTNFIRLSHVPYTKIMCTNVTNQNISDEAVLKFLWISEHNGNSSWALR